MENRAMAVQQGGREIEVAGATSTFSREQVELIKRTVAKGSTDDELAMFMQVARRVGLDPFARQIHAIKRWDQEQQRETMAIQIGIDGFRLIAERTGHYLPGPRPVFVHAGERLVSAVASVQRCKEGAWHLVEGEAFFDEYVARKRDGKPTRMWAERPRGQLAKCAEALALRRAFPVDLSGVSLMEEDQEPEQTRTVAPPEPTKPAGIDSYPALQAKAPQQQRALPPAAATAKEEVADFSRPAAKAPPPVFQEGAEFFEQRQGFAPDQAPPMSRFEELQMQIEEKDITRARIEALMKEAQHAEQTGKIRPEEAGKLRDIASPRWKAAK